MTQKSALPDPAPERTQALWDWFVVQCLQLGLGEPTGSMEGVSGDASFRRYFRGHTAKGSWILVDAPVEKEDSRPFLSVQHTLARGGVRVPAVICADTTAGFICLEDFGAELLWGVLEAARNANDLAQAQNLYHGAFAELIKIQHCNPRQPALPVFDSAMLLREMQLFSHWLCQGLLQLELSGSEQRLLHGTFAVLIDSAQAQTQVYVHRDFHSRNLMITNTGLGVLDFQDAVLGPVTYDVVSLLKDCYIAWPAAQVQSWALQYLQLASAEGIIRDVADTDFLRSFALMGVQRHLKAAGIFCRLFLRDGKSGYLKDIPRTLGYIAALPHSEPALAEFSAWLQTRIMPALGVKLAALIDVDPEGMLR